MVDLGTNTQNEAFYAFEAKSIQKYLFTGGRLRDVVGGSYLVDHLCQYEGTDLVGNLIANVLDEKAIPDVSFSRRAGGACFFGPTDKATVVKFRASLRLALSEFAPDMDFVDAIIEKGSFGEALQVLADSLNESRNMFSVAATSLNPFVAKDPRTGGAGVDTQHEEIIDISIQSKREVKKDSRISVGAKYIKPEPGDDKKYVWPIDTGDVAAKPEIDLSDIDTDENGMVGFIHADGNAVGRLVMKMAVEAKTKNDGTGLAKFRAFSESMAKATLAAAQLATKNVLIPEAIKKTISNKGGEKTVYALPARPIVLGGDDLTIIVRGDLAQEFTVSYLQAFAEETKKAFDGLEEKLKFDFLPTHLSAGAGIVYVSAKFPFDQCHELAEQMARVAKTAAKQALQQEGVPNEAVAASTLLFHKMTFSLAGSEEQIKSDRMAMIGQDKKDKVHLTAGPYCIDENATPSIAAFDKLYKKITADEKISGLGKLREITGLLQTDPNEAQRRYDRWVYVTKQRSDDYFSSLKSLAKTCLGVDTEDDNILLMAKPPDKEDHVCILADIILLNSVGYLKSEKEKSNAGT